MTEHIYLDYAATTPADADAVAAATPYFSDVFFNPSSAHSSGQIAARALDRAREQCAETIGARSDEIIFTSGGTEAVNTALLGVDYSRRNRVVISAIEHDGVFSAAERLRERGVEVRTVTPNRDGIITPAALEKELTQDTALVCVMTVNNITGAIQPVKALSDAAHRYGALMFTDAVQAVNLLDVNVSELGADMLAVSAHKLYSIKGAGLLYVRRDVKINPLVTGGEQERGLRGGTQNVPAAVAMGAAMQKAAAVRGEYAAHARKVSGAFLNALKFGTPIAVSPKTDDIVSVVFEGINGGRLAVALSCAGVCCSVGSACSAGSATPPRALLAMGLEHADCAVRFSFGRNTSLRDAVAAAETVNRVAASLIR